MGLISRVSSRTYRNLSFFCEMAEYEVEKFVYHTHKEMDDGDPDREPSQCTRNAKYCYRAFLEKKIRRYNTKWVGYPSSDNTWENAKEKLKEVSETVHRYWRKFCKA